MAIRKSFKKRDASTRPRCDQCFYYDDDDGETVTGLCRRYPASGADDWPIVSRDDWCGEHVALEAEEHLSIAEAGKRYFGLSSNGSYLAAKRGDLPWVQIGRYKRVPVAAMRHLQPREE